LATSDESRETRPSEPGEPGSIRNPKDPNDVSRWSVPPDDIRVLDTSAMPRVAGLTPLPTVYVGSHLLVANTRNIANAVEVLQAVANPFHWTITQDVRGAKPGAENLEFGVTRLLITVNPGEPAPPPDAFALLQHGRASRNTEEFIDIGLEHVLVNNELDPLPYHFPLAFGPTPYHFPLSDGSGPSSALMTYLQRGSGARQPVSYVGAPPDRRTLKDLGCRRPVVAVLDTGCAHHDWFAGLPGEEPVVNKSVRLDNVPIGAFDPGTEPDLQTGDLTGPLDGEIDDVSGHGTFIAGLVHQTCPDADILAWRVVPSAGPILEYDVLTALAQIAELAAREAKGLGGGHRIDILSLSLGYYHETPHDLKLDHKMLDIITKLTKAGVLVVCSAGNDATSRPMFPAAFAPWNGQPNPFTAEEEPMPLPVVSVAALNPNLATDALFSNAGTWVRARAEGASVMSTMPPTFQGGLQPMAATTFEGRDRASIDPDDFRGGFAVWSGTSFASPVVAGRLAQHLLESMRSGGEDHTDARIERGRAAVEACTDITS
jgi:serine protease